jgi:hypothetical protein
MTDQQISDRGLEASQVLASRAYREAMDSMKAQIIQQWKDCPIRDAEGQVLLLQLAKLCEKFDGILSGMVEAGKLASHKIEIDSERNESAARRIMRRVL